MPSRPPPFPLILIGGGLELRGLSVSQLFDLLGGFAVLAFLLVYAMVAIGALSRARPSIPRLRRWLVAGSRWQPGRSGGRSGG